jgi:alpha-ketoglutarate-dependent taurine dioxygenase
VTEVVVAATHHLSTDPAFDALRRVALWPAQPLPAPARSRPVAAPAAGVVAAAERLRPAVDAHGLGILHLDRPLTLDEFVGLAERWGEPLTEHAPTVGRFVERDCVLNIVARWDGSADVDRQPFSTAPILLHTEGSRRPAAHQPRYLLFHCIEAPARESGGQTVVVAMDDVAARLTERARHVLGRVAYAGPGMSPLLRSEGGRAVFSFRDFGREPLAVACDPNLGGEELEAALGALVEALYDPQVVTGLSWAHNSVLIVDNRRVFHGRTAMPDDQAHEAGQAGRWLRRIRVRAPDARV